MTQLTTGYSPFVDWLPKVSEADNLQLAEIIQLELYRYLLSRTNVFGAVCTEEGDINVNETNAAFQLRFMSLRLTERFVCKSLHELIPLFRTKIDIQSKQKESPSGPLFTLSQFNKFIYLIRLLEFVAKQDIFEAFGCDSGGYSKGKGKSIPQQKTRRDSLVHTLQVPCDPSQIWRASGENPYGRRSSRKPLRRPRPRQLRAFFSCM